MNFQLTYLRGERRADSRLLAQFLGNQHRPTLALIEKYLPQLEEFGMVIFQKTPSSESRTGQRERFALLNEDQAYFLLSLSRNTAVVVQLKVRLVRAFGEARQVAALHRAEYLPTYHLLHDQIHALAAGSQNEKFVHMNVNRLVNKTAGLDAGQRARAPLHQQSLLAVAQAVAATALADAADHHSGYEKAKAALTALRSCTAALGDSSRRDGDGVAHGQSIQAQ